MLRSLERAFKGAAAALLRFLFRLGRSAPNLPRVPRKILVIRQHNQLGDMLCVVPLLRALRSSYPSCSIALVASPVNEQVMQHLRFVDEVILFDKRRYAGLRGIVRVGAFVRHLRSRRFDLCLVPSTVSTSFTSDLLAFLSGARVRIGAGAINGSENPTAFFFNLPVDLSWTSTPHRHQTLRNLDIASPLGVSTSDLTMEITLRQDEAEDGRNFVGQSMTGFRLAIGIHPGAGKVPNRWGTRRFGELANTLAKEYEAKVFITSGPMDEDVMRDLRQVLTAPCTFVSNQPIRRVSAILRSLDLVITNDTGIMHVAAASGAPVLSLFGPTDPLQWAPAGAKNRYIRGSDATMDSITLGEVLIAARDMLKAGHQ